MAAAAIIGAAEQPWVYLNTPRQELLLANTLVTGQTFRWRQTPADNGYDTFTGVVGPRLVQLRQLDEDVQYRVLARSPGELPAADAAAMYDYFNLGTSLSALSTQWAAADARYARIAPHLPGCRMLRQDPVECLFQFICSSNNHISRIQGMVERLCSAYGSPLLPTSSQQQQQLHQLLRQLDAAASPAAAGLHTVHVGSSQDSYLPVQRNSSSNNSLLGSPGEPFVTSKQQQQLQPPGSFFAFPTLEQLAAATEDALRADGFGYRAKYIVGSVQELLSKPGGGQAWLLSLRERPYQEAHEALCTLPGVGPKVAACICLFSLDKHDAIPVDTHVWTLVTRYYAQHLAKKSLTPKLHAEVQQVFVDRFGPYAGWAHNCLFISELASHRHLLPAGLATRAAAAASATAGAAAVKGKAAGMKRQAAEANAVAADVDVDVAMDVEAAVADESAVTAASTPVPGQPAAVGGFRRSSRPRVVSRWQIETADAATEAEAEAQTVAAAAAGRSSAKTPRRRRKPSIQQQAAAAAAVDEAHMARSWTTE